MVSALGYSCLVHITRADHQGISNRHDITLTDKERSYVNLFIRNIDSFVSDHMEQLHVLIILSKKFSVIFDYQTKFTKEKRQHIGLLTTKKYL